MVQIHGTARSRGRWPTARYGNAVLYKFAPPLKWWRRQHNKDEDELAGATEYAAVSIAIDRHEPAIWPCDARGNQLVELVTWENEQGAQHITLDMRYLEPDIILGLHETALIRHGYVLIEEQENGM